MFSVFLHLTVNTYPANIPILWDSAKDAENHIIWPRSERSFAVNTTRPRSISKKLIFTGLDFLSRASVHLFALNV